MEFFDKLYVDTEVGGEIGVKINAWSRVVSAEVEITWLAISK